MKKLVALLISLTFLLTLFILPPIQVLAGTSGVKFIREGMFDGDAIGVGDWRYRGNISVVQGQIFFNDASEDDDILTNRTKVERSDNVKNTFDVNFTLNLKVLAENKKFGFVYGLENFIQTIGSPKSSFVYFEKKDSEYYVGINGYDESGNERKVFETHLSDLTDVNNILTELTIYNDNSIVLKIDGEYVFVSKESDNVGRAEGFVGFGQTGLGEKNVTNEIFLKIDRINNLFYNNPRTPRETVATFDNDEYNKNEWYIVNRRVDGSRGIVIEDGALFFDGAGETSMFATKHIYSNFELIFDVYDAKNICEEDSVSGPSGAFCIAFGDGFDDPEDNPSPVKNGTFLAFDANRDQNTGEKTGNTIAYIYFDGKYERIGTIPEKYAFLNNDFDVTVKVRICITVIDGMLTVKMKLATETQYETVYTHIYADYNTPSGCIRLMGHHLIAKPNQVLKNNRPTNLKIDDVRLYNFDENPSVVDVAFMSNKTRAIPDYQYEDTWSGNDLLDFTLGK
ncbi:MAG: hypothetical protein IJQ66_00290 [Clostridia bacterium]|nr:hypothetical protein [Clostridia bacterium]